MNSSYELCLNKGWTKEYTNKEELIEKALTTFCDPSSSSSCISTTRCHKAGCIGRYDESLARRLLWEHGTICNGDFEEVADDENDEINRYMNDTSNNTSTATKPQSSSSSSSSFGWNVRASISSTPHDDNVNVYSNNTWYDGGNSSEMMKSTMRGWLSTLKLLSLTAARQQQQSNNNNNSSSSNGVDDVRRCIAYFVNYNNTSSSSAGTTSTTNHPYTNEASIEYTYALPTTKRSYSSFQHQSSSSTTSKSMLYGGRKYGCFQFETQDHGKMEIVYTCSFQYNE